VKAEKRLIIRQVKVQLSDVYVRKDLVIRVEHGQQLFSGSVFDPDIRRVCPVVEWQETGCGDDMVVNQAAETVVFVNNNLI